MCISIDVVYCWLLSLLFLLFFFGFLIILSFQLTLFPYSIHSTFIFKSLNPWHEYIHTPFFEFNENSIHLRASTHECKEEKERERVEIKQKHVKIEMIVIWTFLFDVRMYSTFIRLSLSYPHQLKMQIVFRVNF